MTTVTSVLTELKKKGTEKGKSMYAKHGMPGDHVLGVSVADMKAIAKGIKGQQALAYELFATGYMDAMYLAGMVARGSLMTPAELNAWAAGGADFRMVAEHTVPWVAVENPQGREMAMKWIRSQEARIEVCGWRTYSGILAVTEDSQLDLAEIRELLDVVVRDIKGAEDRVRLAMNGFVVAVGTYVKPLLAAALAAAEVNGVITADMGDTACKVTAAADEIRKVQAAGGTGKKKKMLRC